MSEITALKEENKQLTELLDKLTKNHYFEQGIQKEDHFTSNEYTIAVNQAILRIRDFHIIQEELMNCLRIIQNDDKLYIQWAERLLGKIPDELKEQIKSYIEQMKTD